MCPAVWVPVNCGTAQAGQNGQEDCHAVSGDVRPQVSQGNGAAADSGLLIEDRPLGYVESFGGEVPPERDRTASGGTSQAAQAASSTLVPSYAPAVLNVTVLVSGWVAPVTVPALSPSTVGGPHSRPWAACAARPRPHFLPPSHRKGARAQDQPRATEVN